jgi:hypothetical protein
MVALLMIAIVSAITLGGLATTVGPELTKKSAIETRLAALDEAP